MEYITPLICLVMGIAQIIGGAKIIRQKRFKYAKPDSFRISNYGTGRNATVMGLSMLLFGCHAIIFAISVLLNLHIKVIFWGVTASGMVVISYLSSFTLLGFFGRWWAWDDIKADYDYRWYK